MTTLHTGAAFAAAGGNGQALFDFAPWWVKLIVGIIMVCIAGGIHFWEVRRQRAAAPGWDIPDVVKGLFGILGLLVIFQALGVF